MQELVDFVRRCLDEDERVAQATAYPWPWSGNDNSDGRVWAEGLNVVAEHCSPEDAEHIARWDPARVLAEVEAKRRILDMVTPGDYYGGFGEAYVQVVRELAQPYAGQPGWREEWRA